MAVVVVVTVEGGMVVVYGVIVVLERLTVALLQHLPAAAVVTRQLSSGVETRILLAPRIASAFSEETGDSTGLQLVNLDTDWSISETELVEVNATILPELRGSPHSLFDLTT